MKKGGERDGGCDCEGGGTERRSDVGTKRGKTGRRERTRAKPGNQLVYYICIHLLDPHWTICLGRL